MTGISQEALKLIACLAMLIDHIGYVFIPDNTLRIIGRMAFPLYSFLLCQGVLHTKSPVRYLLRFLLILVISEIPFDILFYGGITFEYQNVMFTLLLGLLMGLCFRRISSLPWKLLCIIPFALAADFLKADYGAYGILITALFLLFPHTPRPRLTECLGLLLLCLYNFNIQIPVFGLSLPFQLFSVLAMIPIALYNGKKASTSPFVKWFFYLFYPLHLVVLLLAQAFISSIC